VLLGSPALAKMGTRRQSGRVVGELEGERMRAEVDDEDGEEDEEDRPVIVEM
jgi:hypothetical protein